MDSQEIDYLRLFKTRIRYYVPIFKWLPKYDYHKDFVHDFVAGVTVAMLLIPQSLSYAINLAKLEPVYGLYSCFIPLIIYGILGTSRQLSVGPEALVSLLIGNAVTATAGMSASMDEKVQVAAVLCLLVGIIASFLGLARLGFMDSVLSRALLRGFITAVACVILIEQLPELLGIPHEPNEVDEPSSPFSLLMSILQHVNKTNWVTVLISVCSILFLFGFGYLKKYLAWRLENKHHYAPIHKRTPPLNLEEAEPLNSEFESFPVSPFEEDPEENHIKLPRHLQVLFFIPEILIVVAFTILMSYALHLHSEHGVSILGDAALGGGFRVPHPPKITPSRFKNLLTPAIIISILGFVESIVVSKKFASRYQYPVSANRELVAFGTVNLLGSVFNCFPTFASIARSQVSDTAGARTQLAGVITGFIILITILFLLPMFYYLPKSVMASIVLVAAAALLEFEDIVFMWKIRAWWDMGLMLLTFLITIFWSVESGTLISIGLSLVLVVKHSTAPKISILGKVFETEPDERDLEGLPVTKVKFKPLHEIFRNAGHALSKEELEILVVRVDEALFFANTGQMKDRLRRAEAYGGWMHVHPSEEERRPMAVGDHRKGKLKVPPFVRHNQSLEAESSKAQESEEFEESEVTVTPGSGTFSETPLLRAVIFDIENMPSIDASALQILIEIVEEYHSRGIEVCFVKLREASKGIFLRSGLLGELVGSDHFFRKISDAETFLREKWAFDERLNSVPFVSAATTNTNSPAADAPKSSFSTYNVL